MTSWGQIINAPHDLKIPKDTDSIADMVTNLKEPLCVYGKGKSYGDVALNPNGILFLTDHLDNFLYFDTQNGIIRCEPGVLLRDIQQVAIKYGWLLAVTPGTQLISVGGAIANDVHGKNHHLHGTFGHHLRSLELLRTDGERIKCSPNDRSDWFKATVGGLGLTGIIIEAEIQLLKVPGTI
ncbi:FAD-binding oxidoreductase [Marinomonas sp. GJ51-6]|uniref:FAD-binding oxidoreductase n=1 Tax=Marinomonas sp. GJ51-6 TaxID=2992802 RepID=UPI0029343F99|nr:FAD-binding oxidoreductase [Marinomonas sp. GJ51-6]WOD07039.1 FAD-binding oxidoreductase [Marinomonas sp. GJ51-6]